MTDTDHLDWILSTLTRTLASNVPEGLDVSVSAPEWADSGDIPGRESTVTCWVGDTAVHTVTVTAHVDGAVLAWPTFLHLHADGSATWLEEEPHLFGDLEGLDESVEEWYLDLFASDPLNEWYLGLLFTDWAAQ